jgi:hypothetical protein
MHKLRVGDWVEVLSKEEILRTLDQNAQLDGMPFMPEMFAFCGQKLQVHKRAHKTCDTVFPVRGRRVDRSVHLETRCNGSAHGGCQAGCLIFWKDAWLKPAGDANAPIGQDADSGCSESIVVAKTQVTPPGETEPTFSCQATRLPYATKDLNWWDPRQYAEDLSSGNVTLWQMICGATYFLILAISNLGIGLGRPIRGFWDKFHRLWRGYPFPRRHGNIPQGQSTPAATLDLEPGELVRIRPYQEILKTLDTSDRNRGLYFDAEEVPYCGTTHRVLRRITRIINERTGKMQEMKTPCVVLDSVICQSRYSECRLFCPRSIYAYWREIWLERVEPRPAHAIDEIRAQGSSQCETAGSRR